MRKNWWKVIGVLLMIYCIIFGFLMPLKPGVSSFESTDLKPNSQGEIVINTYNARLTELNEADIRAWLRHGVEYAIEATRIKVVNSNQLIATFDIPAFLPSEDNIVDLPLIIDAPKIGAFPLPSGIFVTQDSVNIEAAVPLWSNDKISNLNSYEGLAIPFRPVLNETIRNTYFHVSLWFSMFILFLASMIYAVKYLRNKDPYFDNISSSLVEVGTLFGILGLVTGSLWAKYTWGTFWTTDVKLNMSAASMMIYAAYLVLRSSMKDDDRKAVISSSYNIFAFFIVIPLIFVIPRMTDSLHPGNGGNPALGGEDLDSTMRMIFYPAIIAFTLLGLWITELTIRYKRIKNLLKER